IILKVRLSHSHPHNGLYSWANALRRSGSMCDALILVKNQTFRAHRLVLACASRRLEQKLAQADTDREVHCQLEDLSPKTFQQVLDFAYTQSLEVSEDDLQQLLLAAQFLEMHPLEEQCQRHLDTLRTGQVDQRHKGTSESDEEEELKKKSDAEENLQEAPFTKTNITEKTTAEESRKKSKLTIYSRGSVITSSHCSGSMDERSDLASDMEPATSLEKSGNCADYKPGRPLDSDDVSTDESTSSATGDDIDFDFKAAQGDLSDAESDEDTNSSSTESADFADHASRGKSSLPAIKDSICKECGRGPFRSIKLHLRHCTSLLGKTFQCFRCEMFFPNEAALKEHRTFLYSCDVCGQVFSNWDAHHQHQPPNRGRLCLICFCSESMPKACAIYFQTHTKHHCKGKASNAAFASEIDIKSKNNNARPVCQRVFNHSSSLSRHMRYHKGTMHKCTFCGRQFPQRCDLIRHLTLNHKDDIEKKPGLKHLLVRPEAQNSDNKQPTSEVDLDRMRPKKGGRVNYKCQECGKRFRLAYKHERCHKGERPYRCLKCGRGFKKRVYLMSHKVVHQNVQCTLCGSWMPPRCGVSGIFHPEEAPRNGPCLGIPKRAGQN
uniref:Zinc finger and BTB domain containing 41 n=1 Tax=Hippocampus comes TaxID=109280 RepID=A0A3Q3DUN7_HIPCM